MSKETEKQYSELKKKYRLPDFKEMEAELQLSDSEETNFLLKLIVRRIAEKLDFFAKMIEEIADYEPRLLVFRKSDLAKTQAGLQLAEKTLQSLPEGEWGAAPALLERLAAAQVNARLTPGDLFWPVRVALAGQPASPPPEQLLWALGRGESLRRIREALVKVG